MLWAVEGILKWDFSMLVFIASLEEEKPHKFVLVDTMAEKYTAWKG
jgi:hypothetical protein